MVIVILLYRLTALAMEVVSSVARALVDDLHERRVLCDESLPCHVRTNGWIMCAAQLGSDFAPYPHPI